MESNRFPFFIFMPLRPYAVAPLRLFSFFCNEFLSPASCI
jgi:hypothetical protein